MCTQSSAINNWIRAGIFGVALAIVTTQMVSADSLRAKIDPRWSNVVSEGGTLDETDRATNMIQAGMSGSSQPSNLPSAAYAPIPAYPESVFASGPTQASGGTYVVVDEHGNTFVVEGVATVGEVQAASGVNQELRSIQRIEDSDVANDAVPELAVHPNLRSIQMIEGEEAVAEAAQPASVNAYSVCLACSTMT